MKQKYGLTAFESLSVMFTGALALVPPNPDVLPLAPVGNIAAVQGNTVSDGDTRLYYQKSDNSCI